MVCSCPVMSKQIGRLIGMDDRWDIFLILASCFVLLLKTDNFLSKLSWHLSCAIIFSLNNLKFVSRGCTLLNSIELLTRKNSSIPQMNIVLFLLFFFIIFLFLYSNLIKLEESSTLYKYFLFLISSHSIWRILLYIYIFCYTYTLYILQYYT